MTDSKRICLIYTGGTIGMQRSNGILRPPENPSDFLNVAPELADVADFDFCPLMNKDSTNIVPADWVKIATAIHERAGGTYCGFVIAHGTDTMHFTASAIAFALGSNVNFPVVFTGAQTIPEVAHGDARINLLRAFKVCETDLAEVVISFGDFIFRACRAQKKDERRFDAFESPSFYPIGYITEQIQLTPLARRRERGRKKIDFQPFFSDGIVQFSLIPGLEPDFIHRVVESPACKGVILQSFGAGNVPSEDGSSLLEVVRAATSAGKPIIVTSQFPANATLYSEYETGVAAVRAGAIPTGNMTSSCAAAKFRWVLATVDRAIALGEFRAGDRLAEIGSRMQRVFVDEMDDAALRNRRF